MQAGLNPAPGSAGYHLFDVDPKSGKSPFDSSKIKMYRIGGYAELRLVLINGKTDWFMHKMAERFGMPRGFPVIVNCITGEVIASGFYPKFANDAQTVSFLVKANRATRLTVLRKWSGYLTGLIMYKTSKGNINCIVCSKKSADTDSPYVIGGKNLWKKILTQRALHKLWDADIRTVWAETLTKEDQKHATVVKRPHLIITGAGMRIDSHTIRPKVIGDAELADLLKSVGLSKYVAVAINIPKNIIETFVNELTEKRDYMTETLFRMILRKYKLPSDSLHMSIVGDRLEGLILKFHFKDGSCTIEKYKFAGYTKCTMCVRTCSGGSNSNSETKYTPLGSNVDMNLWTPSFSYARAIEAFVQRWVFTEKARRYYRGLMLAYGEIYDKHLPLYNPNDPTAVGPWITAADELDRRISRGFVIRELSALELKQQLGTPLFLIVLLGPVGSGKTTAAELLADSLGIPHIDGDTLGLTEDLVRVLKAERNFTTVSQIARTLACHGIALVSTGGGALGSGWKKWSFTGIQSLEDMLNAPVELIVFTPSCRWQYGLPSKEKLQAMYADKEYVRKVTEQRMTRAEQKISKSICNMVATKSAKNAPIAQEICEATKSHFQFPHAMGSKKMVNPHPAIMKYFLQLVNNDRPTISRIFYRQRRGLFLIHEHEMKLPDVLSKKLSKKEIRKLNETCSQSIGHDTEAYEVDAVSFDLETEDEYNTGKRKALRLTMFSVEENGVSRAWDLVVLDEGDRHLTINSGKHQNAMMREVARTYNKDVEKITLTATVTKGKGMERVKKDVDITYPLRENTDKFILVATPVEVQFLLRVFIPHG